jgi:nitrite reductase/ring-hydroxylating ferredoxin subunit
MLFILFIFSIIHKNSCSFKNNNKLLLMRNIIHKHNKNLYSLEPMNINNDLIFDTIKNKNNDTISTSTKFNTFFNHWHCISIKADIDIYKPLRFNIGELPLVLWKTKNGWLTTLNICRHMGSRLDNGIITNDGCLKCRYHGLEINEDDRFGETIEHEGKIFWSYKPIYNKPHKIPFYNNKDYEVSFLQIDMEASLPDSAFNTMDLRHPEYVHKGGFGSSIPPTNIKQYKYKDRIGLSFDYQSNPMMKKLNDDIRTTQNFHMYIYPTFTWSRVSFKNKHLIIAVNLLPLKNKKTRWFVTICHNYYKSTFGKNIIKGLATFILSQDYFQMKNQYPENKLKSAVLFNHIFKDEDVILWLRCQFSEYKFPDIDLCLDLYNDYNNSKKSRT